MAKDEDIDPMIIEDLLCRFIVNLPKEEQTTDRLFFHIQAAHWFYSDFYVNNAEIIKGGYKVPHCNFRAFSKVIFKHCPFLKVYYEYFDIFFQRFSKYMSQIPVFGAMILNASLDKILLVTNYRNTSYSFPKGKINQNETGIECAVREVWEETGINISKYISEKDFIEFKQGGNKAQKMYVVCGIEENLLLKTTTRYEIGRIEWVPLSEIEDGKEASLFIRIMPFIRPLKLWIRDYASARLKNQNVTPHVAMTIKDEGKNILPFDSFKQKLDKISQDFETRLQSMHESTEEELAQQNPFSNFKLDTMKLKATFA